VRPTVEAEPVDHVGAAPATGCLPVEHHDTRAAAADKAGGGETGETGAHDDHVDTPIGGRHDRALLISDDIHDHPTSEMPRM
jgi:hypothetical protein